MTFEDMSNLPHFYYKKVKDGEDVPTSSLNLEDSVREWASEVSSQFHPDHTELGMLLLQSLQLPGGVSSSDIDAVRYFTQPFVSHLSSILHQKEESMAMAAHYTGDTLDEQSLDCYAQEYFPLITRFAESVLSRCSDKVHLNNDVITLLDSLGVDRYFPVLSNSGLSVEALRAKNQWSKKLMFDALAKQTDLVSENDVGEADVNEWRAQALQDGPIFIKPHVGAQASHIMKVELSDNMISISSLDTVLHSYLLAANDDDLRKIAFKRLDEKRFEIDSNLPDDSEYFGCIAHAGIGSIEFIYPSNFLFNNKQLLESRFVDDELSTVYHSPERFFSYSVESDGKTTLISDFDSVTEVLEDISSYYSFIEKDHYAEKGLESALTYNGRPVEARVILQELEDNRISITGTYFKTNGEGDFNCISNGGFGVEVKSVLSEAQRKGYLPDITEKSFIDSLVGPIQNSLTTIGNLLNRQMREHIPEYPFSPVSISEIAFDFIYVADGVNILPKLIDVGFDFGTTGMGQKAQPIMQRTDFIEYRFYTQTVLPYLRQSS